MNDKFFQLPQEKQAAILNAGYRVFSENAYANSPMREIAEEAGISKSLLFHYFRNKKELYLYLWTHAAEVTVQVLTDYGCYSGTDVFEAMEKGLQAKIALMARHPHMTAFTLRAFYEKDEEVREDVQAIYQKYFNWKLDNTRVNLRPEGLRPGIDVQQMYREMYWVAEGYLWESLQRGTFRPEQTEQDFLKILAFWRQIFLQEGGGETQ